MIVSSAAGERTALRGYRWQYDQIAVRVYDALHDQDFVSLRLTDPNAGRIDDLVLVRSSRTDAFQFRSSTGSRFLTLSQLTAPQINRSGNRIPSLVRSLAACWQNLKVHGNLTHVHLVTDRQASIRDRLGQDDDPNRPAPDHFQAFRSKVLEPINTGDLSLADVDPGWIPALTAMREAAELGEAEFERFLGYLNVEIGVRHGLPESFYGRRPDIINLSNALYRVVSIATDVVELDEQALLRLMGWQDRPFLRNQHEFPVAFETYAPLQDAIDELQVSVASHDSGYIAVVGPPGAGKSTLLSQAFSASPDHVVRYFAFVPKTAPTRTRLTARGFLHDIVVMLRRQGLEGRERALPSDDVDTLRQQLSDLVDKAGERFSRTQRRTIIIVDGLDHVDRDYGGPDHLIAELPRPDEIPNGVLFVVGSRTLNSLNPHARTQLEERNATVDLQHHRLTATSVLDICNRVPFTAGLPPPVHHRIVELSDGHPLALSYILNRLRDPGDVSAEDVLAGVPAYEGDIAGEYLAVWGTLESNRDVLEILSVCSRLRIGFTTEWLLSWASQSAVRDFQSECSYLFRIHHNRWQFFHDSFRQFASDKTSLSDSTFPRERAETRAHRKVADLCAQAAVPEISAEELHHRFRSGQHEKVLALATQKRFRSQYQGWRSPDLIRQDIECALGIAAGQGNVLALFGLLLALIEVTERTFRLDEVDIPGLLFKAGLIDEALAFAGVGDRGVPLAQVYDLATKLGRVGNPAGRLVFDSRFGLDEPDQMRASSDRDDAATAWTKAAVWFRPIQSVIDTIRNTAPGLSEHNFDSDRWRRYTAMVSSLVGEVALKGDTSALNTIDRVLVDDALVLLDALADSQTDNQRERTRKRLRTQVATVVDLRVRIHDALVPLEANPETSKARFDELLLLVKTAPLYHSTMLQFAELLYEYGMVDEAKSLLNQTQYGEPLSYSALGKADEDLLDRPFRYWRLHYLTHEDTGLEKVTVRDPAMSTGLSHNESEAEFATRVDVAVRTLAWLGAKTYSGRSVADREAWASLLPGLDLYRPTSGSGLRFTMGRIQNLQKIVVDVAIAYGNNLPQRLGDVLTTRLQQLPPSWGLSSRLDIGAKLRSAGVQVSWYRQTLEALEDQIANEDAHTRLDYMGSLVDYSAEAGDWQNCRRFAGSLIRMGFGVGWREDIQFDYWLAFLKQALANTNDERLIDEDAAWFARLLTAIATGNRSAIGSAANDLPTAIVPTDPVKAVRVFEYLVRHGTANHTHSLANLVAALVAHLNINDTDLIELSAGIIGEMIAPATNRAYPQLAESFVKAAKAGLGRDRAGSLAKSVASRIDIYALPTTRKTWKEHLGLQVRDGPIGRFSSDSSSDDYDALVLRDGQRIARHDVPSRIQCVEDIVTLRREEKPDSRFPWDEVIKHRTLTNTDIRALCDVFSDGQETSLRVLSFLAEAAEQNGDTTTALRLATTVLQEAEGNEWLDVYRGVKPRAATLAVRLGGQQARVIACQDLADRAVANSWFPRELTHGLPSIIKALDPDLDAGLLWSAVRVHLEGIAEPLSLPIGDVLTDHGCRWWLPEDTADKRAASDHHTPAAALAELVVGHLSHPAWVIRGGATTVVTQGLQMSIREIADALARFAQPGSSDDILERGGRCLAAAAQHDRYVIPAVLVTLQETLSGHPSQILRDLASASPPAITRPLSPLYRLDLPPPVASLIASRTEPPSPHNRQYKLLARCSGISLDTLRGVSSRYKQEALALLPTQQAVEKALASADNRHSYMMPFDQVAASRAAFGRVLADLTDAKRLMRLPTDMQPFLRTVDIARIGQVPQERPSVAPAPMSPNLDQTITTWRNGIETRLEEYITASTNEQRLLIGALIRLAILKGEQLGEEFVCGTTIGPDQLPRDTVLKREAFMTLNDLGATSANTRVEMGEPLVLENSGYAFHQREAQWFAFRPDIATTLGWVPNPTEPGSWDTAAGDLAAETIWWVDGWWGRGDVSLFDTASEGWAVVITPAGLADLTTVLGDTTRHFNLTRGIDTGGELAEPVSETRSLPMPTPH